MKKFAKLLSAAAVIASLCSVSAEAATRVYLMRGLLEMSPGLQTIATKLRRHGAIVTVGSWLQESQFVADAQLHPHDRLVFGGHSMGDYEAAKAANELQPLRIKARVVGIDPLCTNPSVNPGIHAVNIYGNGCGFITGKMGGAFNVNVSSYGLSHVGMPADRRIQALFISFVLPARLQSVSAR